MVLLHWLGGKRQLLPELKKYVPETYGTYYEPFAGGAALFFALAPKHAVLADVNLDVINFYNHVRWLTTRLLERIEKELEPFADNRKEVYYSWRERHFGTTGLERAALFWLLNRSSFNGLWRVNRAGKMNAPIGTKTPQVDREVFYKAAEILKNTILRGSDFEETVRWAVRGDLVYFDPPYIPLSKTANFTGYSGGFSMEDHRRLARVFADLKRRGVYVILSNSDTPETRELYRGHRIETVMARRVVNCNKDARGPVAEVIIT
jgi:DNA adenine methylase